ncbi:divalent-cation tolerance protein CutA [bacterium]|nr:divalent-cation tolerance protein CutA [bacterium]
MQDSKYIVILSTAGNPEEASRIAEKLVSDHLVACVNIVPGIQSIYWWNNGVQKDQEVLMVMKTEKSRYRDVELAIKSLHSYEVPEIISLPLENGSEGYLKWIENTLKS